MTTGPELADDTNPLNGLAAAVLFVALAAVFVGATFGEAAGFPDGSTVATIGYALFDLPGQAPIPVEGFLAAFESVDVVIVAALVGAVTLASRESDGARGLVTALTDGGRPADDDTETGGEA